MRIGVLWWLGVSCAFAQVPSIDQSLSFKQPSAPRLSPDGGRVVWVESAADWESNRFLTHLWLSPTFSGAGLALTHGKDPDTAPEWSPDGQRIAFLREREGKKQIWLIDTRGGEAWALTKEESTVSGFRWAPDGTRIAFSATAPESAGEKARKERYGDVEVVGQDHRNLRLSVVDVPTEGGAAQVSRAITDEHELSVGDFAWSPDGTRIAYSAGRDPDLSSSDSIDLYLVDVAQKKNRRLTSTPGPDSDPVWSPDGSSIAYRSAAGNPQYYFRNEQLMVLSVVPSASPEPRRIASNFDEEVDVLTWTAEGIYFSGMEKTAGAVFLADLKTGAYRRVLGDGFASLTDCQFSRDARRAVFLWQPRNEFTEVAVSPVLDFSPKAISRYGAQYRDFKLAQREMVSWKSKDGTVIEGVLWKPANNEAGRKYPLLVAIHGGPTGIDRAGRSPDRIYPLERLAARGALVLRVNYRGSAGYGEQFRSLNYRNLGIGDAWDVLSGVDAMVEKGIADPDNVGVMGWSQGGYISAFLSTSTTRFKAVSVGAGISDWATYYVNTDIHPFTRQYLGATPWEDPEIYKKTSPITYVQQAKTPTLIQHGDQDKRVPPPNAFELFQALRDRNVPVRLVLYKGFGHGIDRPKQQRHLLEENERWFLKYIWGDAEAAQGVQTVD